MRRLASTLWGLAVGEFRASLWRTLINDRRLRIVTSTRFSVRGAGRIQFIDKSRLYLGTTFFGFVDKYTRSLIRVRGSLLIHGVVRVGRGASWDIGSEGILEIRDGTYFSPYVRIVCSESITVGARSAIGWGVEILDADFHQISTRPLLEDSPTRAPVEIGDHVWIGSNARILKGVRIADGCIVAAGSVVTKSFTTPGCLIAGVPARIIREGVIWA